MSLSHYDPLASLRAFEGAFTRFLTEPQANRPWAPSVDIYETENELVLKADLPDVESWDALAVSRWAKFQKQVREIADGIPYDTLTLLAINDYAWECETFAAAETLAETVGADSMAELLAHVG